MATMDTPPLPRHTINSPQSVRPCSRHYHTRSHAVAVPHHIDVLASIRRSPQIHCPTRSNWPRPNPIAVLLHRPFVVLPICDISPSNYRWTRRPRLLRLPRRRRPTTIRWHRRPRSAPNTMRLSRTVTRSQM